MEIKANERLNKSAALLLGMLLLDYEISAKEDKQDD